MLGLIPYLKYNDHDIIDEKKFLELVPSKFLMRFISSETHMIVIEPQLQGGGCRNHVLLNLFDILYFGCSQEITACVKMFLICVHIGYMWLERLVSIDIDLIVHIKGLPSKGLDLASNFFNMKKEHGLDISSISDPIVKFETQALACKLLRKCIKYQVPTKVIETVEQCAEGVQINSETFLLNQFLTEWEEVQDKGT
jgi:hypothetical protein